MVNVTRLEGRRLLGRAGRHEITIDRKVEDGGADSGCTSAELLLLAVGACATGSVRNFLDEQRLPSAPLGVDVSFRPSHDPTDRDSIAIVVSLPANVPEDQDAVVKSVVLSGGVTGRLALGSVVDVDVTHGTRST